MAVTYGFFNSHDGDRTYDAEQFGSLFEGIIRDGIFQNVRNALRVTAVGTAMQVKVDAGRCWFDNTWTNNDSVLTLPIAPADSLLPRVDAVVVQVDKRDASRRCEIKVVKGTPASNPAYIPTHTDGVSTYPIAFVNIPKGAKSVTSAMITDRRGTAGTPWITGPLSVITLDSTIQKLEAQFEAWFDPARQSFDLEKNQLMSTAQGEFNTWLQAMRDTFSSTSPSAALAARVVEMENRLGSTDGGYVVFDAVRDSDGHTILDSSGDAILAKLVYVLA